MTRNGISTTVDRSIDLIGQLARREQVGEALQAQCETTWQRISQIPWAYHYFDYLSVMDALLAGGSEPVTKTLFGNFQSPLLHSWEEARFRWSKNNAHLAHGALVLSQAINHELPALRAAIDRTNKLLITLHAKQTEFSRSLQVEADSYESLSKKHHLQAPSLDALLSTNELQTQLARDLSLGVASALPSEADALAITLTKSVDFQDALRYYRDWMKTAAASEANPLPNLQQLATLGPAALTPSASQQDSESSTNAASDSDAIDWGDFGVDSSEPASTPDSALPNEVTVVIPTDTVSTTSPAAFCQAISEELELLKLFFKQRISDASSKSEFLNLVMGRALSAFSDYVKSHNNEDALASLLQSVNIAHSALTAFRSKLSIVSSDARLNEVIGSLLAKRSKLLRLRLNEQSAAAKRSECEETLHSLRAKQIGAKAALVTLKGHLEAQLSTICRGRVVSISVPLE